MTDMPDEVIDTAVLRCYEACAMLDVDATLLVLATMLAIVADESGNFQLLNTFVPAVTLMLRDMDRERK
jgi:hypothetical protein